MSGVRDVGIVGGGPAGLTAALFLARYLRSVVLVDSGDPRNWEAVGIHGYLGLHGIAPAELRARGREEARAHGAELLDARVLRVEGIDLASGPAGDGGSDEPARFRLHPEEGPRLEVRRLLIAIGLRDIWPEVEGLERCYGKTTHHCPDCDGYEARGREAVVLASGRAAAGMALALATWTDRVTVCTNGEPARISPEERDRLRALHIPVIETRVERLAAEDDRVRALVLADGRRLPCERLFFTIGCYPADWLGDHVGCDRDEEGRISVDERQRTSVPHVYAAGDITPGPELAIRAAADGARAALSIHRSLLPEERRLPLARESADT